MTGLERRTHNTPFAAIVRTMGNRPGLLADTLQSVALQDPKCLALIVAHGTQHIADDVAQQCANIPDLDYQVHCAPEPRRRGYALNAGLTAALRPTMSLDFLLFLDDHDIIYPFFTKTIKQAFQATDADVIYAASNREEDGSSPRCGYVPLQLFRLFIANFIPLNSYAVRVASLRRSQTTFDEDLDYSEDWLFLLSLAEAGMRFAPCFDVLSEFRMFSDGDATTKADPFAWKRDSLKIRKKINSSLYLIPGPVLAGAVEPIEPRLPFSSGPDKQSEEIAVLKERLVEASLDAKQLRSTVANLSETAGEVDQLRSELSRLSADMQQERSIREDLRVQVQDLHESMSWRVTKPLRKLYEILQLLGIGRIGGSPSP